LPVLCFSGFQPPPHFGKEAGRFAFLHRHKSGGIPLTLMKRIVTKLAVLALLTLAIVGCGADVNMYFDRGSVGLGGSGVFNEGYDTGYYYLEDSRYDYWWYYSDGSQWWHWDDHWVVDTGFIWYDNHDDWYYYEYDPFWYDPYYDPYDSIYYDDPYYWDDVYLEDDGYYGDGWYYEDNFYRDY